MSAGNGRIDLGDDPDEGYITIAYMKAEVRLDLWRVQNKIAEFHDQHKHDTDEAYNDGLVSLVESLGLPRPPFAVAGKLVARVNEAAAALAKKNSPSAASPASTGLTPFD